MDILIITPLYYISGREKLFRDTNAVHYLVRTWAKTHRVFVVNVYFESMRRVKRYVDRQERRYFREGYFYDIDNVSVVLIEVVKKIKAFPTLTDQQSEKVYKIVEKWMKKNQIKPAMVISHIPSTTFRLVRKLPSYIYKAAVMHATDMRYFRDEGHLQNIKSIYNDYFCRSLNIYQYFEEMGLNNLNSDLIFSGVPICHYSIKELKKSQRYHILYAGKLIPLKNLNIVIEALSSLSSDIPYLFDIYGNGSEEKKLRKLVKKNRMEDKVTFHSFVPREQLFKIMEEADIFVMPSEPETFGLVYLEAMSRGCITIGTRGQGIDGIIIDGKNGFLVESKNVDELKEIFEYIFGMKEEKYLDMQIKAIETGQEYNEEDMGNRYLKLVLKARENGCS